MIGGDFVATSTFEDNIYIDDKAADILIKGLDNPKPLRPKSRKSDIERGEALLIQFRSRLEKQTPAASL